MDAPEVVITMLIGKLREVRSERAILRQELQDQLSQFIEQLQELLYDTSSGREAKAGDGHLQQQRENVMICAREAEDIADVILVESSMLPKFLKGGPFIHKVRDLIGYGDSQAKARKLIEKLVELSWHYTKMQGRRSHAERGPKVYGGSMWSVRHRAEYEMKRPTTTTRMVSSSDKPLIIGREDETEILKGQLNDDLQELRVISVTGEEGIGKTALVRSVYDCPETERDFGFRAWISCSSGMSLKRMLVELIKQSPEKELKDLDLKKVSELRDLLGRWLMSFRYLIVLDDLKDFGLEAKWLKYFIYNNEGTKGSRVIVTSRDGVLGSLALRQWVFQLPLRPLKPESGRQLLLQIEDNGVIEKILTICRGSPMKLLLCGGLVRAADAGSSDAKWFDVPKLFWTIEDILSLSYGKLPHLVKPCLLYLCLFPRGSAIPTRRVFQLWYAEGVAHRDGPNTAEACLQELLNRNIVQLVTRREADDSPKTFCLPGCWHDRLSKFGVQFSLLEIKGKDKSIPSQRSPTAASPWLARCFGDSTSLPPQDAKTASRIRSYISFETGKSGRRSREVKQLLRPLQGMRDSALLRVLDLEGVYKPKLQDNFGDLLPNLRYLGLRWTILDLLPKSVANLSKLETLDLKHTEVTKLPGSVLTLKHLRHLYMTEVSFDDDAPSECFGSNMETLWGLLVSKGGHMLKVLGKFKGLRKLGLTCHSADVWEATENISTLTMLEFLRLRCRDLLGQPGNLELGPHMKGMLSLSKLYLLGRLDGFGTSLSCLPQNLRVLTLSMSELQYDPMSYLGQLRHLVRLSLLGRSCVGQTITFPGSSFPSLRELHLWKLQQLREIRIEAGSMKSLEELEIRGCMQTRKIDGLENASKLKHIKLTMVTNQFAVQLERSSLNKNLIVTSRELILGSEPSTPKDWSEAEIFDMIRRGPFTAGELEPVPFNFAPVLTLDLSTFKGRTA